MQADITPNIAFAIETELHAWRTRALNVLLTVATVGAAPVMGFIIVHAAQSPEQWPAALAYLVIYLCVVGLAVFRRLNLRLRAWGLVLLGYAAGTLALAFGGLAGDGRVFLLAVPILALTLIGVRSGLIMAALSLFVLAAFTATAHLGWLAGWILIPDNPLQLEAWLYETIVVGMCLAVLITLLRHLHLFLTALVVEKTRLLETIRISQILYRTTSELSLEFAYVVRLEPDDRFVSEGGDESFTLITGYTPDELGRFDSWTDLVYSDDVPILRQHLQTILSGQACVGELRVCTKSGKVRWLRVYGQPIWDEMQERVIRVYGAIQDITSHKRAEEALEKRAIQLALLSDIGSRIAAVLELNSLMDRAVRLVQEGFGYHHVALFLTDPERDDLVMRARSGDFADLFPCDHRIGLGQGMVGWVGCHGEKLLANNVRVEPRYANFFPDVIPTRSELSVPVKTGEKIVGVLDIQSPHLNAFDVDDVMVLQTLADQIATAIENARLYEAIQQELVEREQAEEALQKSEEMARAVLNANTESVLLLDDQGTILALNQTAAKRFGKAEDALVGLCLRDMVNQGLMPLDLAESREAWIRKVVRSGEPVRFEDERDQVLLDSSMYPVFDAQGRVARLAIFARDVTARRRAEQQAAQSERLAAMGRLAASLAHEINNPLQIIRNNLELVQGFDLETDEYKARLDIIHREIERLIEIGLCVLDFARPPAGIQCQVSIVRLIKNVLALVGKQLQTAHIQVTTDFPADLPPLFAAPDQISQVLLNLALNAIDATGEGGHLHITAHTDGDTLAIAMTNDGPPILEEHIERIFEPFFTTKPDGTGLGLPICHSIIEQHGGTISVQNLKDDKGVTSTITLPIARLTEGQETVA